MGGGGKRNKKHGQGIGGCIALIDCIRWRWKISLLSYGGFVILT